MRAAAMAVAGLAAATGAQPARATQWVTYSFTGTGTAAYFDALSGVAVSAPCAVAFSGRATVDLDAHLGSWDYLSNGGTAYSGTDKATYGTDVAAASPGALTFKAAGLPGGSYRQDWTVAAILPAGLGADGRFPVFAGPVAAGGAVSFDLAAKFTDWAGAGRLASLSVERAAGPAAWTFSVADSPVPEPATWALLTLGFGAVGWAARRRYRSRAAA